MTLHTAQRGLRNPILALRPTMTEPAQVWDVAPRYSSDPGLRRTRNIRTLQAAPVVSPTPIRRGEVERSGVKETAKKLVLGSGLGVFMVLSVYAAAQGEHTPAPQDPQQVVASVEGHSR